MFNKATYLSLYRGKTDSWPDKQTIYLQRVGEPGLSNSITLSFEGLTPQERAEFAEMFNRALHVYYNT